MVGNQKTRRWQAYIAITAGPPLNGKRQTTKYVMRSFNEKDWLDPAHEAALWADRANNLFNLKAWTDLNTLLAEAGTSKRLQAPSATCEHKPKKTNFLRIEEWLRGEFLGGVIASNSLAAL